MRTGIDHGIQFTLTVTCNDDRLTTNISSIEVVIVWNLAFMCQINPIAFKDVFHLKVKQGLVCKY